MKLFCFYKIVELHEIGNQEQLGSFLIVVFKGSSPKVVGFSNYAKIVVSLNKKKSTFLTPLNCALKVLILALKDSAEAFVLRLSK